MAVPGKYFILYSTDEGFLITSSRVLLDYSANVVLDRSWGSQVLEDRGDVMQDMPNECIWNWDIVSKRLINYANGLCLDVIGYCLYHN